MLLRDSYESVVFCRLRLISGQGGNRCGHFTQRRFLDAPEGVVLANPCLTGMSPGVGSLRNFYRKINNFRGMWHLALGDDGKPVAAEMGLRVLASQSSYTSGIAGRYATALYDMADEAKQLDAVADDLRGLKGLLAESADLRRLVRSPLFGRQDQIKAILAVLEKAGVNDLTRRFVGVVGQNRRLFALSTIIEAYLETLASHRGEETAYVSSAVALNDDQQTRLVDSLKKAVGSKVRIETEVDPSLIGGLVVRVGSRMIDSSVKTKLQRMKLAMKGA